MKQTRKFSVKGKKETFSLLLMNYSVKSEAKSHAKQIRKKGNRVRVIVGKNKSRKKRYYLYKSNKSWF